MKKKNKYYVSYVEGCSYKLKSFNTEEELNSFVAKFAMTMYNNPDNWIEFAFKGEILLMDQTRADFNAMEIK